MDLGNVVGKYRNHLLTIGLLILSVVLWGLNLYKVTTFTDLELWGFITGLWSIWLAVLNRPSNWAIGLVNEGIFFVMFWQIGLYANALLQIFFAAVSVWGWLYWLWGGSKKTEAPVRYAGFLESLRSVFMVPAIALILIIIIDHFTGTYSIPDNITTAISIMATYLLARRYVENWIFWIVADFIYIALFISQGLFLWAALYVIFVLMCAKGIIDWRRIFKTPKNQEEIAMLKDAE